MTPWRRPFPPQPLVGRSGAWAALLALACGLGLNGSAQTQRQPHIAYLYPAGGQQGSSFKVKLAGQRLDGVTNVYVTGDGVTASVLEHIKPLNGRQIALARDRMQNIQRALKTTPRAEPTISFRNELDTNRVETLSRAAAQKELEEIRLRLLNPKNRSRENPQLAEDVTLQVQIASNAPPGQRELRLATAAGLSNPLCFRIESLPEFAEQEPNEHRAQASTIAKLPAILNGQIMPGDVDVFRLRIAQPMRLVVVVRARELIPYLADAVPGWFQATVALYDAQGKELAYADDYRFNPDPVLFYEIPYAGDYFLEIKDALYRGREDFVYRVTVGELPFITSLFPVAGQVGQRVSVELTGWNLPVERLELDLSQQAPGLLPVTVRNDALVSNPMPFWVETLPSCIEQEPNNTRSSAQAVKPPILISGRINQPGDCDLFQFEGRAGDTLVAEVRARRLNSPLDSILRLTDAAGNLVASNDDHEDKAAGLTTHHADSFLSVRLPADGTYLLHLADAQGQGGPAYTYCLRISPPRPDFELRVVPASVNARAGASATLTVYALRKDGFTNQINLVLKDAPRGFRLSTDRIPAGQNEAKLALLVPMLPLFHPATLRLEGHAIIDGQEIVRPAVPAEDMMQAFAYHHLVPAQELQVAVLPRPRLALQGKGPGLTLPKKARPKG
jgi:hypothetical protein